MWDLSVGEKPPRRLKQPGYVAIEVPDLERAAQWYRGVANLFVTRWDGDRVYLRVGSEHHSILLIKGEEAKVRYVAYETHDDGVSEELREALRRHGVIVEEAEPVPGCLGLAFRFQDPEGNWCKVYRAQERRAPRVSPGAFPILKLGHFTYRCRDVRKQAEFYRGVVGARISDYFPGRACFLRIGTDHHGIAFQQTGASFLHHAAFDVGSWENIKLVLDWHARQEWAIDDGPVRHGPGNNIAVYVADPFGFRVEYYAEMEQITDDEDHIRTDYIPFRNLWKRSGAPEGYHEVRARDEHGRPLAGTGHA